ncbi:MAG: DUF4197 domain-containing protein [Candidatus Delongbacteria bacterium]|nr:DUF4197 domain-containing protein [Candidatus Delongbacteria bacterium]
MNIKAIFYVSVLAGLLTSCEVLEQLPDNYGTTSGLSETEIRDGLSEALEIGIVNSVNKASRTNGFYQNQKIKVHFPMEAYKVREAAMDFGMERQVEEFEKTLNRAAENASTEVKPIFMRVLKEMTIKDARDILKGENDAATRYFERKTRDELENICYPEVEKVTSQVQLTKHWEPIIKTYNRVRIISGDPEINPDLDEYVTEKTIDGLFVLIANEEQQIRENPEKRVTDLLKKVFGS